MQGGQLRGLAVTGSKRWPSLPNVPTTMQEAGYPGFISDTFSALFAPAGTPPAIIALAGGKMPRRLSLAIKRVQTAQKAGFAVVAGTPEQLTARMAMEIPAVKALVQRAGIKIQQ